MMNLLSVKNLSYKNIYKNISFNISEKSFNILIGKNGVGKTTLIYSILGLTNYTGEIKFKYDRKDIGCVSDFSDIICDNVFDYLQSPLTNLGYSEEKSRKIVYSVSKKMGIDKLLDKQTSKLTNEERLLILLTHSVVHNPKLVIIDNTLDELCESNKNKFINYLINMKTTVILVTNDSRFFRYSNQLLIMMKYRIETIKESNSITRLENLLVKNNSELPFSLDLSNRLYSYRVIKKLYNNNSELVDNIWK